jgi:hypothetical protein
MDGEQGEEVEVLGSIFPDEFVLVSDSPIRFAIALKPVQGGSEEENHGE